MGMGYAVKIWLEKQSIATKLILSFVIMALIGVIIGLFGIGSLRMVVGSANDLYHENILGLTTISNTYAEFQNVQNRLTQLLFVASDERVADTVSSATQNIDDPDTVSSVTESSDDSKPDRDSTAVSGQVRKSVSRLREVVTAIDKNLEEYRAAVTPEENDDLTALVEGWNAYKIKIEEIISNVENGKMQQAMDSLSASISLGDALENDFIDRIAKAEVDAAAKRERMDIVSLVAQLSVLVLILVTLVASPFVVRLFTKRIARPIRKISVAAEKLSLGDLDIEIETNRTEEISKLSNAFQSLVDSTKEQARALERLADGDMTANVVIRSENDVIAKSISELVSKMRNLIMSIKNASNQVAEGAVQISDSSNILSNSASEQASVVEELTASMEEISSHTTKNASSARETKELAISARSRAMQGNDQMEQLLNAMAEIRDSSEKVSKVIKIIEDIAFQTNILALNAAVEASRAGASGRGFAVVAEEVKNLALRSATAANETTDTIQISIRKASEGEKVAHATATTFADIVKDIEKAAESASEIAAASEDQALGIQQINQGILQVSELAQTTAATAEEETAASQELSEQVNSLRRLLDDFTI
jgi:methyl-accepting chemotaxis protein